MSVTTTISDHRIIDSTPSTMSRVTGPDSAAAVDGLAKGVERAGADVAIDDADAAERQRPEARPPECVRMRPSDAPGRAVRLRLATSASLRMDGAADCIATCKRRGLYSTGRCGNNTAKAVVRQRDHGGRDAGRRSGLEARRQRRRFPHQRDGHAAVGGEIRIVGKQRLGVGPAGHHEELRGRHALLLEDLADRVGAVGGKVPGPVAGRGAAAWLAEVWPGDR